MSVAPSRIPVPNEVIAGKYRVVSQVGEGGMAVIFAATHIALRQRVAIKVILPQYAGSPELKERFFREARALALIKSQHVARIFDVGTLDTGAAYLVLEYLEGLDLHQLLDRDGPLTPSAAAAYVLQASEALSEAHGLGILHRDLKPSNLFLVAGENGEPSVKLLDFGLAKLTEEGVSGLTEREDVMGSPSYMAPEQIRGLAQADARSDVWSMGVTLYELLTNAYPFEGATPTKVAAAVLTEPPISILSRRPNLPLDLARAIMDCLIKEPERRMASAKDLADCLRPFAVAAPLPSFAETSINLSNKKASGQRRIHIKPLSSDATMRMAPSEPTYGGMLPLAPLEPKPESAPRSGVVARAAEASEVSEENIRTLIHAPGEKSPLVAAQEEASPRVSLDNAFPGRAKPIDSRTQEPTLVTLDAGELLEATRKRRRRLWIVMSTLLAIVAVASMWSLLRSR